MSRVDLRLLGGSDLLVDGVPAVVDTRKAVALGAYLAVERAAARDTLAALLWPESDDTRALAALRRTLSALRSALGEGAIAADRRTVGLSGKVTSDVTEFREAVAATASHDHDLRDVCSDCIPLLAGASTLYRGDFLAGFSLRDAPDFDDWARTVAEALRLDAAAVLERLSAGRAAGGDYRGAIEATARWIALDPLHEPAYRHLMRLSAWAGDRSGAIEAYRRCVSVLNEELGVAPLEETTECYEAILDDDLPRAPGARRDVVAHPAPQAPPAESPLIGRSAELEFLERQLVWAATGGRVVFIRGAAWMGKTRLLEAFCSRVAAAGHRVLLGRGYRAERGLPFGVVVQLLRSAAVNGWLDLGRLPRWAIAEASRLVPELGDDPPPEGVGEARLFDAVATLLFSIAAGKTLVLAVDDGQWVDAASASLLSYLTRRMGSVRVMLLVAHGGTDDPAPDVGLAVEAFDAGVVVLELEPLGSAEIAEVAPDPDQADLLLARTGGVPVLVAEALGSTESPESSVRRYIDRTLEATAGLAAQILSSMAVLGAASDVPLLKATSGRTELEVVDALDELLQRRIVREVPGSRGFGFSLEDMGRVVYERLSPVRRRLLHGRAADAIVEAAAAGDDARSAATAAQHLQLGGREAEAASWFARAGDLAAAEYAQAEAEAAYRSAIALGHPSPGELRFSLGGVLLLAGRYREALDEFRAAAAAADADVAAEAEHRIGDIHRRLGRFDLAERHFQLAEATHPEPSALYGDWALLEHRRGHRDRSVTLAARAVRMAGDSADRIAEARARDILGIVADDAAELERALSLSGDDEVSRLAALNSLAYVAAREGELERAIGLVEEGITLARAIGDRHRSAALLNHLADLYHRTGRAAESQDALTEAVRLFVGIEPDAWEPEVWMLTRW